MIRVDELISDRYRKMQRQMHANPRGYGGRGDAWAATVMELARRYDAASILDYGCGQGSLGRAVRAEGFICRDYDPAIPGLDGQPSFADLVVCTDVLEHIEPDRLDKVLAHIRALARRAAFLVIATRPSNKLLPNGGNAHLIIEPGEWWEPRVVSAGFTLADPPTVWPQKIPGKCWVGVVLP